MGKSGDLLPRKLDHTVAGPPKKTLNLLDFGAFESDASRRAVQIRALAQRRITIYRLDQPLGDGFGIQAKELRKLPHAFAMRQPHDDCAPIRWHSY